MKIFNTMSGKKEELVTINKNKIMIYACGPTVYNYIHIGNARPLCVFDTLRRYLQYIGYEVKFVQNYTDIDDKIIKKANETGAKFNEVSEQFIKEYEKDAKNLNIKAGAIHPKATENIPQMIDFISGLIDKGYAYSVDNGDVYFRANKFEEYGKLSHQPLDQLELGARISIEEKKENATDFALWKGAKPDEPYWETPWGKGRPGWHIECSTMAKTFLADTIDIHCGGQDLIFPHHENEIAQSESFNGCTFANYWMHNGYINVNNKKMSKSLNNFFTVREIGEKYGYEPIRYMMLASHYRSPISFSEELIQQSVAALDRLYNCKDNLEYLISNTDLETNDNDSKYLETIEKHKKDFCKAMDDDLNTADALATIFNLVKDINRMTASENISKNVLKKALSMLSELSDVLGLLYVKNDADNSDNQEIENLIAERQEARKNKDWAKADSIRDKLKQLKVVVEDTAEGVKWHFEK